MNSSDQSHLNPRRNGRPLSEVELDYIRESLQGLRFGSVQITVQDGVIVQIERTEKRRLTGSQRVSKGENAE